MILIIVSFAEKTDYNFLLDIVIISFPLGMKKDDEDDSLNQTRYENTTKYLCTFSYMIIIILYWCILLHLLSSLISVHTDTIQVDSLYFLCLIFPWWPTLRKPKIIFFRLSIFCVYRGYVRGSGRDSHQPVLILFFYFLKCYNNTRSKPCLRESEQKKICMHLKIPEINSSKS